MEMLRPGWIPRLSALLALALLPRGALGSCGTPPRLSFAELQDESKAKEEFPVGTTVTYNCRPGYQRVAGQSPTLTCEGESVWSEPKMFCQGKSCGHPRDLANGKVHITDLRFGSNITFSCDEGFRLVGPNTSLCVIDETRVTWNHELPFCEVVKCSNAEVENGRKLSGFGPSYSYQDAITFGCEAGYFMVGSRVIVCQANNLWSPPVPTCEIPQSVCSAPQFPNGKMLPSEPQYVTGNGINLICEANGVLPDGAKSMTSHCKGNNVWDPPVQICQWVCPDLVISHGRVKSGAKPHYVVGDHVTIECYAAYTMPGEPKIHCTDKFKWEPVIPECRLSVYIIILLCVIVIAAVMLIVTLVYKKIFSQKRKHVSTSPTAEYTLCKT
ncbi:complement receptor type 1 isoform X7 [Chelonia mydas]|uniref:complement receptor type 1 isoform X7 n=1 Tax=Chelonia mydas TaxID=8469 RepID=UPI001CA90E23|nr:complement receptor type 1 isoform X7 [Chelonia mydas]